MYKYIYRERDIHIYIYICIYIERDVYVYTCYTGIVLFCTWRERERELLISCSSLGCSGMWCFRMWGFETLFSKPLTHISFGCEVPTPSVLRVNKLNKTNQQLVSNPTSSNTTSLNSLSASACLLSCIMVLRLLLLASLTSSRALDCLCRRGP